MRHEYPEQLFTVWQFCNLKGEKTVSIKTAEPNDKQVQHEYQRVLAQVWAPNRAAAQAKYSSQYVQA